MRRASKLLVLEFIYQREIVTCLDLIKEFGYTPGGAWSVLSWLKKQGLVINEERGEWTITDDGINRLIYYGRL